MIENKEDMELVCKINWERLKAKTSKYVNLTDKTMIGQLRYQENN